MIAFPNAKINIGLNVLEKREDGYHNIESIFYPVQWCDAIEAIKTEGNGELNLTTFGLPVPGSTESNLCTKVYNLLHKKHNLPSLNLWLLKCIPMGAGLGGGSADAAFFLRLVNDLFELKISTEDLKEYASQIGSDCTFFIENKPSFVSGTGNIIEPISLDLSRYYIVIVYPQIHVDTKNAYSLITPYERDIGLRQAILAPISTWRETIVNDFEEPLFKAYPKLAEIKDSLYKHDALYASMTGSGSALYGVFEKNPYIAEVYPSTKIWTTHPIK